MSKVTLRNCFNRLRDLGQAPSSREKAKGRSYRNGFKRSMGSLAFLFVFFILAAQMLDSGEASTDNHGIFLLLFFAALAAALGAFFAPRIYAFFYSHSLAGRRHQAGKSRTKTSSTSTRTSSKDALPSKSSRAHTDHERQGARRSSNTRGQSDS